VQGAARGSERAQARAKLFSRSPLADSVPGSRGVVGCVALRTALSLGMSGSDAWKARQSVAAAAVLSEPLPVRHDGWRTLPSPAPSTRRRQADEPVFNIASLGPGPFARRCVALGTLGELGVGDHGGGCPPNPQSFLVASETAEGVLLVDVVGNHGWGSVESAALGPGIYGGDALLLGSCHGLSDLGQVGAEHLVRCWLYQEHAGQSVPASKVRKKK